ncbi:hypothetical protein BJV77DRAFT_988381 [Russula vinacea]|nr:hypothetical protein BJV77DRAFT_988381 [Russula vinacea]
MTQIFRGWLDRQFSNKPYHQGHHRHRSRVENELHRQQRKQILQCSCERLRPMEERWIEQRPAPPCSV